MPARIYALAKELNLDSKDLVDIVKKVGITGKGSALASLTDEEEQRVRDHVAGSSAPPAEPVASSVAPTAVRESVQERKQVSIQVGRSSGRKGPKKEKEAKPAAAASPVPLPPVEEVAAPVEAETPAQQPEVRLPRRGGLAGHIRKPNSGDPSKASTGPVAPIRNEGGDVGKIRSLDSKGPGAGKRPGADVPKKRREPRINVVRWLRCRTLPRLQRKGAITRLRLKSRISNSARM